MMYVIKLKSLIIFTVVVISVISLICFVKITHKNILTDSEVKDGVYVPIIMYHSINEKAAGNDKYIITPDELENDIKYLKDNGYKTVFIGELINYVYEGEELPEKPIVLTFDDGFYNNYTYLYPLLEKYDEKAVISIVGEYTDKEEDIKERNAAYSYLNWSECEELLKSGRVEIQNHSYDFHNIDSKRKGSKKALYEKEEDYKKVFKNDLDKMQERIFEKLYIIPNAYTYPYGLISESSIEYTKELGFKASLSCCEGMNHITHSRDDLYCMKRFLRTNDRPIQKILRQSQILCKVG